MSPSTTGAPQRAVLAWSVGLVGAIVGGGTAGWALASLVDVAGHGRGLMPIVVGVPVGAVAGPVLLAAGLRGGPARARLTFGLLGLGLGALVGVTVAVLVAAGVMSW